MSQLDQKVNEVFGGKVVRKDLVRKVKVGANVPVFVLEYLPHGIIGLIIVALFAAAMSSSAHAPATQPHHAPSMTIAGIRHKNRYGFTCHLPSVARLEHLPSQP